MALDCCFTLKRIKRPSDIPLDIVDSNFISKSNVDEAERLVNERRSKPRSKAKTLKMHEKHYEGCEGSFKAMDESRAKANADIFDDTGLMVSTCRHGIVLFAINMRTPGECQFYAIAAIRALLEHLPPTMKIGLLYDIGCQLELSCIKWDFLGKDLSRIDFAVSIFHAYGHQWACQLVYHPRKREGFGLTDGETCERVWSQLKFLIPVCRVSGVRTH